MGLLQMEVDTMKVLSEISWNRRAGERVSSWSGDGSLLGIVMPKMSGLGQSRSRDGDALVYLPL